MDQKSETLRRYIVFFLGLLTTSFGVAFVTKATLGTSPIAAIPYSLSLILPVLSLGTWVVLFNLLLIVIQVAIQRKDTNKFQVFLEVIMAFLFGYGVDLAMLFLRKLSPEIYGLKIPVLLIGCFILAFGAYLEVIADVVMLPGEGTVKSITKTFGTNFGTTKVAMDVSMSVIALIFSLIMTHQIQGVREGTIIAALLVGFISRFFSRICKPVEHKILAQAF